MSDFSTNSQYTVTLGDSPVTISTSTMYTGTTVTDTHPVSSEVDLIKEIVKGVDGGNGGGDRSIIVCFDRIKDKQVCKRPLVLLHKVGQSKLGGCVYDNLCVWVIACACVCGICGVWCVGYVWCVWCVWCGVLWCVVCVVCVCRIRKE